VFRSPLKVGNAPLSVAKISSVSAGTASINRPICLSISTITATRFGRSRFPAFSGTQGVCVSSGQRFTKHGFSELAFRKEIVSSTIHRVRS
jgi:hypothetical protein